MLLRQSLLKICFSKIRLATCDSCNVLEPRKYYACMSANNNYNLFDIRLI